MSNKNAENPINKDFQRINMIVNNFLDFSGLDKPFEPILNKKLLQTILALFQTKPLDFQKSDNYFNQMKTVC